MSEELKARRAKVLEFLRQHEIAFEMYEHPEAPTIDIAREYWHADGSKHCKNLFFRNHKGNRHYLVVFDCEQSLAIHDLEHRLRQGKAEEDKLPYIRQLAGQAGGCESFLRTALALEVFHERGLITMTTHEDRVTLCLNPVQGKVDLAACPYLSRLRDDFTNRN